jgi:sodium-coupled neutral amino acid transporter 11
LRPLFSTITDDGEDVPDTTIESAEESTAEETTSSSAGSLTAGIFSLVKAMIGIGVLALPSGLAVVSDYPGMLWPANALMLGLGALSGYTFSLYGRLAFATNAQSLGDLWSTIYSSSNTENGQSSKFDSKASSFPISMANFAYCYGCSLSFLLVIGDAVRSLMQLATGSTTGLLVSRQAAILSVVATCLWPLTNLKSLKSLVPMSVVGVLGTLVSTAFIVWRCPAVIKSSPYANSQFLKTLSFVPQFSTYNRMKGPAPLVLLAMGCVALMAHFSAPDFLNSFRSESDDGSSTNKTSDSATTTTTVDRTPIRKYNQMTVAAFTAVGIINVVTLSAGFLTFGGNSAGIVLNNYAASDLGAALSRLLVTVSVVGGFPFLFSACRSSAVDLWKVRPTKSLTATLLASMTAIAMVVQDAGFVVSFNGALMGTAIVYIFPSLLFLRLKKNVAGHRLERNFCRFLVGFGIVSSLIGGTTSVINSYFPHLMQ